MSNPFRLKAFAAGPPPRADRTLRPPSAAETQSTSSAGAASPPGEAPPGPPQWRTGYATGYRIGHEAGLQEGRRLGREAGVAEGVSQGIAQGVAQERADGGERFREMGYAAARAEGQSEIAAALRDMTERLADDEMRRTEIEEAVEARIRREAGAALAAIAAKIAPQIAERGFAEAAAALVETALAEIRNRQRQETAERPSIAVVRLHAAPDALPRLQPSIDALPTHGVRVEVIADPNAPPLAFRVTWSMGTDRAEDEARAVDLGDLVEELLTLLDRSCVQQPPSETPIRADAAVPTPLGERPTDVA